MTVDRVIQLLKVEQLYCLKQTGHSQQPINKEVAEALDIAIEAVKQQADIVRCKDCKHSRNMPLGLCYLHTEPCNNPQGYKGEAVCVEPDDFCSYGKRRIDNG